MLASNPAIKRREAIAGYNFLAGQGSNQATFIIKLQDFEERASKNIFARLWGVITGKGVEQLFVNPLEANMVLGMIYKQTATIKDAQILAFGPPMIPGFSASTTVCQ
jgi:HAE1 family hydrophobic/amphiphilic exporter-1